MKGNLMNSPRVVFPLLLVALSGCAVGPDYHAPENQLTHAWRAGQSDQTSHPLMTDTQVSWWENFNDPLLNSLIQRATQGNLSLQQSVLRIAGAREQVSSAQGGLFPTLNGQAAYSRQQLGLKGELQSQGVYDAIPNNLANQATGSVNFYQGGFDASWELDLWGKTRRQIELARASEQQQIEQHNDALVSLEAEVTRTYLQLRAAQASAASLTQQIAIAQQSLELTQSQMQNGLAPTSDVESATAQLAALQAQLPQYHSQIAQAKNALAVLIGRTPGALDNELAAAKPLPHLPQLVAVGVPAQLTRRRPDIRAAEANLHAQTANIGVSVAQLFPSLSLTGQLGVRNTDISYMDNWSSHFYSIGPGINLPIFEGGRLVANVKLARAQQAAAALNYRQTVLTALQEVENALVSYRTGQQQETSILQSRDALQRAFALASENYKKGFVTYITVLDAQRQLAQTDQQAIQAQAQTAVDLVALYKALGGGWEQQSAASLPHYSVFGEVDKTGVTDSQ
ncbi:efflux transporter outer membrane subunit [Rosenbergiella collisarenosi]|uniref:efflux transporter outer membrane subunit n=1 Tax=Rosenbergiella collisarenosi TaxID=1544695 RepID=UPI001BDA2F67|nr:efflux transporter outer membrane subunit [Rosenbergiella collisarenosi]MBT0720373.1 efflux transporter outer membrane subunit [Rosenbergiella collisarenosi]